MNTTEMNTFKSKLDDPAYEIDRSVFRDRNGLWAKEWSDVTDVYVQFDDGSEYELTPDEFKGLNRDQQDCIRHAPSSPLPS